MSVRRYVFELYVNKVTEGDGARKREAWGMYSCHAVLQDVIHDFCRVRVS